MTATTGPSWEQDVERGASRALFEFFDGEGEEAVKRNLSTYVGDYRAHAEIWLKRVAEARAAEEARLRVDGMDLQRRAVEAAERSAAEAALANSEARKARKAAWASVAVATAAAVISLLAWASD